ncbi:MAG TPA: hypothetical protein VGM39_09405 [Kofleriaceae bacterium]|jgi:hypothetical protein
MKRWIVIPIVFFGAVLAASAQSDSDVPPSSSGDTEARVKASVPPPEPVTMPPTADATTPYDPFKPADPGRPEAAWSYDDLSPAEQAVVDRGFDTSNWAKAQQALASAGRSALPALMAQRAQLMLGVQDLATTGVVP